MNEQKKSETGQPKVNVKINWIFSRSVHMYELYDRNNNYSNAPSCWTVEYTHIEHIYIIHFILKYVIAF